MVKIDRSDVISKPVWHSGRNNAKTVIVMHETANRNKGADAYAHHRLQKNGNPRKASWHYTVDDKRAVQHYSEDWRLWHSGGVAVPFTIAVEVAVDGDIDKAWDNAKELAVDISKRNNITSNNIVTHKFYTGKNCPTLLLSGNYKYNYDTWIDAVEKRLSGKKANPPKQPVKNKVKSIDQLVQEVLAGKHGNGEQRMKSLGYQYETVQKRINERYGNKNRVDYNSLVRRTLRGDFGDGATRKRKLGKNYNEVQRRINNMYK